MAISTDWIGAEPAPPSRRARNLRRREEAPLRGISKQVEVGGKPVIFWARGAFARAVGLDRHTVRSWLRLGIIPRYGVVLPNHQHWIPEAFLGYLRAVVRAREDLLLTCRGATEDLVLRRFVPTALQIWARWREQLPSLLEVPSLLDALTAAVPNQRRSNQPDEEERTCMSQDVETAVESASEAATAPARRRGRSSRARAEVAAQAPVAVSNVSGVTPHAEVDRQWSRSGSKTVANETIDPAAEAGFEVRQVPEPHATVSCGHGATIRLEDYESVKISVHVSVPCKPAEVNTFFTWASEWSYKRLCREIAKVRKLHDDLSKAPAAKSASASASQPKIVSTPETEA